MPGKKQRQYVAQGLQRASDVEVAGFSVADTRLAVDICDDDDSALCSMNITVEQLFSLLDRDGQVINPVWTDEDEEYIGLHVDITNTASDAASSLLRIDVDTDTVVDVNAAGDVEIVAGDLTVTAGDVDITAGSLSVGNGVTIVDGGLLVTDGGIEVTEDGITVTAGGVTVVAGGVTVTAGGLTVTADGLTVTAGGAMIVAGLLGFAAATSAAPALKRSTTILQARLGDDSGFATLQGKLQTDANAVEETITPTHTLTLYDAAGTAYKVAVQAAA